MIEWIVKTHYRSGEQCEPPCPFMGHNHIHGITTSGASVRQKIGDNMKYRLEIRAEIRQVDDHGGYSSYNNSFQLNETANLGDMGFLEMTEVLAELHKVMRRLKAQNESD